MDTSGTDERASNQYGGGTVDPNAFYTLQLNSSGFRETENTGAYPPAGRLYRVPKWGDGHYWI